MNGARLRVDGAVETPLELGFEELASFAEAEHERDVSRFHPSRCGDGVQLEAILRRCRPLRSASHLTLHATRDDFHVSIPLEPVRAEGIVLYQVAGQPLEVAQGGPFRFLIRDPAACHTDELDDCANVKYLDRIELAGRKERDTRPSDEKAHRALHERQGGSPGVGAPG
jgi:DMSO/TMAO reductase YedYZ molybdopterin-dependent catalytic subunit